MKQRILFDVKCLIILYGRLTSISINSRGSFLMVAMLCDLPSNFSFEEFIMPEITFKTAKIDSQFPARQKIFWELGS